MPSWRPGNPIKKPNIKFGPEQSRIIIWATNRLVRKGLVNPHCSTADATRRPEQQNEPTSKDNQKTKYDRRVVDAKMQVFSPTLSTVLPPLESRR